MRSQTGIREHQIFDRDGGANLNLSIRGIGDLWSFVVVVAALFRYIYIL